MTYSADGGTIHGTTNFWGTPSRHRNQHWVTGRRCPYCDEPISDRAHSCQACRRAREENRRRFAVRARQTTQEEKVAKAHEQAARFMALRDMREEAR